MSQQLPSFELLEKCRERGLLSKEAYDKVAHQRHGMIKEAIVGAVKRWIGGATKRWRAKGAPKTPDKKGFIENLKKGGLTPGKKSPDAPESAWSDTTANLSKLLALAGLTTAGVTGVAAVGGAIKDTVRGKAIAASYRDMFSEFPELKEKNPNLVRGHFGVLRKFAPSLASNPIVAGSFVKNTVGQGQIDPSTIMLLVNAQSRMSSYPDKPMAHGLQIAGKALGALGG